ncbi:MAG: DUF6879 family protein [Gemmataceae bacterium]
MKLDRVLDTSQPVIGQILTEIDRATLVIAVLTDSGVATSRSGRAESFPGTALVNPNVMFETGYAMGVQQRLLFVVPAGQSADAPFDLRPYHHANYTGDIVEDQKTLSKAIRAVMQQDQSAQRSLRQIRTSVLRLPTSESIYYQCAKWNLERFERWADSWHSRLQYYGSLAVREVGTYILRQLKRNGFTTHYFAGEESWEPDNQKATDDNYLESCREIAKTKQITRVFVLRKETDQYLDSFNKMVRLDSNAGIETLYLLESEVPRGAWRDFGLWDDEIVCQVNFDDWTAQTPRMTGCTFFCDKHAIEQAKVWRDELLKKARSCSGLPSEQELLRKSYRTQLERAEGKCRGSLVNREQCRWYHGGWQFLRLCNVVSSPTWHADWYAAVFRRWADEQLNMSAGQRPKILISGLADYGMLYHLFAGLGPSRVCACDFRVIDLCEVPLEMCRWLEDHLRKRYQEENFVLRLETEKKDLLNDDLELGKYDLIVSDAFLTRFADEDKKRIVDRWATLLGPGGSVVTTVRCSAGSGSAHGRQAVDFVGKATQQRPDYLSADEVESLARDYAEKITSHAFDNEESVEKFLKSFDSVEIARLESVSSVGEFEPTKYARVVLRKKM